MKKNNLNTEGLKRLLPYGGIKTIAERSNVSRSTVENVIKGKSKNPRVMEEMRKYTHEVAQAERELNEVINQLNELIEP